MLSMPICQSQKYSNRQFSIFRYAHGRPFPTNRDYVQLKFCKHQYKTIMSTWQPDFWTHLSNCMNSTHIIPPSRSEPRKKAWVPYFSLYWLFSCLIGILLKDFKGTIPTSLGWYFHPSTTFSLAFFYCQKVVSSPSFRLSSSSLPQPGAACWHLSSWWLNQPHLKTYGSKWEASPSFGVNIKNLWNHHLVVVRCQKLIFWYLHWPNLPLLGDYQNSSTSGWSETGDGDKVVFTRKYGYGDVLPDMNWNCNIIAGWNIHFTNL